MVKLVSDQSEADLAKLRAERDREDALVEIESTLRGLAANIMRVTRGAGSPHTLVADAVEFLRAVDGFKQSTGTRPSGHVYAGALELLKAAGFRSDPHYYGLKKITRGALQAVASELVGQRTQAAAGEHEIYQGVTLIEAARAEARKGIKKVSKRELEREMRAWDEALAAPTPPDGARRRKTR